MRIGLIANTDKAGARDLVCALRKEFVGEPVELVLECRTAALVGEKSGAAMADFGAGFDILVVLGGDGTILQVLNELGGGLPPIFGINIGTLGFLTCVSAHDYREAVRSIVDRTYQLSERTLLNVEIRRHEAPAFKHYALNDAVISRGELSRLIRLDVMIDGAGLTEYNADGLIVSTPTGSTAYSLSAGGPVLAPDSEVFVITPICPHVLTNRSVIVSDLSTIEISPSRRQEAVFLTLDGRTVARVEPEDSICITKADKPLPLAMPPGMSFFEVLRQKLKWSGAAV